MITVTVREDILGTNFSNDGYVFRNRGDEPESGSWNNKTWNQSKQYLKIKIKNCIMSCFNVKTLMKASAKIEVRQASAEAHDLPNAQCHL